MVFQCSAQKIIIVQGHQTSEPPECDTRSILQNSYKLDYYKNYIKKRTRQRLRSASTAALIVPATRHSTLGDRAFPVIGTRLWNSLPDDITTATSLLTFRHKLKTFLFRRSYDNVDS